MLVDAQTHSSQRDVRSTVGPWRRQHVQLDLSGLAGGDRARIADIDRSSQLSIKL